MQQLLTSVLHRLKLRSFAWNDPSKHSAKFIVAILGALGLVVGTIGTVYALSGTGNVCSHNGRGICLNTRGKVGGDVYAKTYSRTSRQQHMTVMTDTAACHGGFVTQTCPFKQTIFDKNYRGDQIVTIRDKQENKVYLGANNSVPGGGGNVVNRKGRNLTGTEWVVDNHRPISHGLINVYETNREGVATFMCQSGVNRPVFADTSYQTGGICSWRFHR